MNSHEENALHSSESPAITVASSPQTDARLLLLSAHDNVLVACAQIDAQESVLVEGQTATIGGTLLLGHKIARLALSAGDKIMKYGAPIGSATQSISVGEHVHVHNMKSDYTKTHLIDKSGERGEP